MALANGINNAVKALNASTESISRAQRKITQGFSENSVDPPKQKKLIQGADRVSLESSIVDMISAKRTFQANVKVIQTEDQVIGTLLDIKA